MGTPLDPTAAPLDTLTTPEAVSADVEFDRIADAIDNLPLGDPDLIIEQQVEPVPLGRSPAFDFENGHFITGGGRGPHMVRGLAGLRYWVEKCLRTARGAHPIHSGGYGLENPWDIIGQPLQSLSMGDLESRIHDALTFHPRIVDVTSFVATSDHDQEAVYLSFHVVLDDESVLSFRNLSLS